MIKHEVLISVLRFYESDEPNEYEDYVAVCNLVWESKNTVWIKGLHGNMKRKNWRKLLKFLDNHKIETLKIIRAPHHKLPLADYLNDHYAEIKVSKLTNRFLKET